jgi:hypothetical protein
LGISLGLIPLKQADPPGVNKKCSTCKQSSFIKKAPNMFTNIDSASEYLRLNHFFREVAIKIIIHNACQCPAEPVKKSRLFILSIMQSTVQQRIT